MSRTIKAKRIVDDLHSKARGLNIHINRMHRLYSDGSITRKDLKRIYAGSFIQFYSILEQSLERLFIGLLMERYKSSHNQVRSLVDIKSYKVAHEVVRGERSYVDWLPYRFTEKRAKSFFSSGKPFTLLEKSDKKSLEKVRIIRNAIAHRSSSSTNLFQREYVKGLNLPTEQEKPAGYLLGRHGAGQSRLNMIFVESIRSVGKLC